MTPHELLDLAVVDKLTTGKLVFKVPVELDDTERHDLTTHLAGIGVPDAIIRDGSPDPDALADLDRPLEILGVRKTELGIFVIRLNSRHPRELTAAEVDGLRARASAMAGEPVRIFVSSWIPAHETTAP